MSDTTLARDDRLSLRLPAQHKRRIEDAARLNGQTLTDFVIGTLMERAVEVIDKHSSWTLSNDAFDAIVAALENPPAPNEALVDLFRDPLRLYLPTSTMRAAIATAKG